MSAANIEDLRQHLLGALKDLRNKDAPMDVDRAKAIAQVATVLVESARVEVEYLKVTGQSGSDFLGNGQNITQAPALPKGITGVTTHRIKG